jgi:hypothetical protein
MTAFTTISNALVAVGAKPFATTIQALRDNILAIQEGDPTAPKIQFAALDTWFTTAGAVGTYAFATRGTGTADVAFGSTLAGSSLVPTSAATSVPGTISGSAATFVPGSALSGTWRCMGTYDHNAAFGGGSNMVGATLWMRIS